MARTHAHGGTVVSALNNRDEISYLREPANYANPRRVKTIPLITLETINYDSGSKGTGREWKFVRLPVSSRCHIMPHPPLFPLSFSLFDFIPSLLFSFFFFLFFYSTPSSSSVFVGPRTPVETNAEQYFSVVARRLPINTDFARTARSTLPVLRYLERLNGTVNYRII